MEYWKDGMLGLVEWDLFLLLFSNSRLTTAFWVDIPSGRLRGGKVNMLLQYQ